MPTTSPDEEAPPQASSLWRNRDYLLLWGGQTVSTLGTTASVVVYPLLILEMTGSPAAAGLAGALATIPYVVFSLPVGALIDRWDRKLVMILCDVGRALALASIPIAMVLHALTIWQIYLAVLVEGTLFVLFNIAEVAALPRVVGTAHLPQAAAQNEASYGAASIVGPSFGTFVYQTLGHGAPFVADAISFVVSVISISLMKTKFQSERALPARRLGAEIAEGLRWLWGKPLIRYMAVLTGGLNLVSAAAPLVIIVLAKQMGAQDAQIGLIFSLAGVGGILGSLLAGQLQKRFSFGQIIVTVTWAMALLFPLYAVVPMFLWLGVVSALLAMMSPIYNVVQFSYRLALIPDELQGRVNSTFRLLAFGLNPVGAALSGVLLQQFGAVPTVIVLSVWGLGLAGLTALNRHVRDAAPIEEAGA